MRLFPPRSAILQDRLNVNSIPQSIRRSLDYPHLYLSCLLNFCQTTQLLLLPVSDSDTKQPTTTLRLESS